MYTSTRLLKAAPAITPTKAPAIPPIIVLTSQPYVIIAPRVPIKVVNPRPTRLSLVCFFILLYIKIKFSWITSCIIISLYGFNSLQLFNISFMLTCNNITLVCIQLYSSKHLFSLFCSKCYKGISCKYLQLIYIHQLSCIYRITIIRTLLRCKPHVSICIYSKIINGRT